MATALLIIDVQNAILAGKAQAPRQAELDAVLDDTVLRLQHLQGKAREAGHRVILIQHDGPTGHRLEKGTTGWELRAEIAAQGDDVIIHKNSADSFFETNLDDHLKQHGITHLIIGGCMTQFCVDTTVRRAVSLRYDITLIADGHMTADSEHLSYSDIIKHHNETLNGFAAGAAMITVKLVTDIAL